LIHNKKAIALQTLGIFVLVFFVVLFIAGFFTGNAPAFASGPIEAAKELAGVSNPRIIEFNVIRIGGTAQFEISYKIGGALGDVKEVKIFKRSKKYPGESFATPEELTDFTLSGINDITKLKEADGKMPRAGEPYTATADMGYNIFTLNVVSRKDEAFPKDVIVNLYDEDYLEEYKGEIDNKPYDVIQCKKDRIYDTLIKDRERGADSKPKACEWNVGHDGTESPKKRTGERDEGGFWFLWCQDYMKTNPGCNCFKEGLDGCSSEQVTELNFAASRIWMWRAACLGEDDSFRQAIKPDSSIEDYERLYFRLSEDKLLNYMTEGIHSRIVDNPSRGVHVCRDDVRNALDNIGFSHIEPLDAKAKEAENNIKSILRALGPKINTLTADFRLGVAPTGKEQPMAVTLNWDVEQFAKEDLGSLRVYYDFVGGSYLETKNIDATETSIVIPITAEMLSRNIKLAAKVDGEDTLRTFSQKFRLVPIKKDGFENPDGAKEAIIKAFDTNYVEYYYDAYVKDAEGNDKCSKCDLQTEKILVLNRGSEKYRLEAHSAMLSRLGVLSLSECKRDGVKIDEECRPDYTDELYVNYLKLILGSLEAAKRLDSCQEPSSLVGNSDVCEFKGRVKQKLIEAGWEFVNTERILPEIYDELVEVKVPDELGQPDGEGTYKYTAPASSVLYYRYQGEAWQWSPDKINWMPVTTIEATGGIYHEQEVSSPVNIRIINYLAENNPTP